MQSPAVVLGPNENLQPLGMTHCSEMAVLYKDSVSECVHRAISSVSCQFICEAAKIPTRFCMTHFRDLRLFITPLLLLLK